MPIPLPNLDDRRFADLVDEARAMVPRYAPDWTNHNPSDPGITLLELFAWLAEQLLYRVNLVTDAGTLAFLRLLNGPGWQPSGTAPEAITQDIQATVQLLRARDRLVSSADCEALALDADSRVARARCLPRRNLEMDAESEQPGHVSLVVVPRPDGRALSQLRPAALTGTVHTAGVSTVALSGLGTRFQQELIPGDEIDLPGIGSRTVVVIASDGALTLDAAAELPAPGVAASRLDRIPLSGTGHTGGVLSAALQGVGTNFLTQLSEGDTLLVGEASRAVAAVESDTAVTLDRPLQVSGGPEPLDAVRAFLEPRRLLTTQLCVVGPRYLSVEVRVGLASAPDQVEAALKRRVVEVVRQRLDPLQGGADGAGWPFGRSLYVSELYELLEGIPGLDHVASVEVLPAAPERLLRDGAGRIIGVDVRAYELVHLVMTPGGVEVTRLSS
jgi:hypothetical protein